MTVVGIDKMGFYTSHLKLDMTELAQARGEDPDKYLIGLGQTEQAVLPNSQDPVSLAGNAALQVLTDEDWDAIDMILVGTETGVDHSKSIASYLVDLLQLKANVRALELKQACFGATAGLQWAKDYILAHPTKKVLVIATDIARYGLHTPGETTQGGGAVAMLVTANPRILTLDDTSIFMTENQFDFWRPLNRTEALVDGAYSSQLYLDFFAKTWADYKTTTHQTVADFDAFAFHLPFTKMGLKALRQLLPEASETQQQALTEAFEASRADNRLVGNLYTGSLYLSLLSLLRHGQLSAGAHLGLFSYGSGAEAELFSGRLQPGYEEMIDNAKIDSILADRTKVSVADYEQIFSHPVLIDGTDQMVDDSNDPAEITFAGITDQKRKYVRH